MEQSFLTAFAEHVRAIQVAPTTKSFRGTTCAISPNEYPDGDMMEDERECNHFEVVRKAKDAVQLTNNCFLGRTKNSFYRCCTSSKTKQKRCVELFYEGDKPSMLQYRHINPNAKVGEIDITSYWTEIL